MMKVHILKTCRNEALRRNSELVFETIETGFPTAEICVRENRDGLVPHGVWIESLINQESEPFWICDTDIIFHSKVEDWDFGKALFAGRYAPQFFEPWTNATHVSRLHPSLMWLNAPYIISMLKEWPCKHPFFVSVRSNLIQWNWVPSAGKLFFYDTCAGLYHALGGQEFSTAQCQAYSHLFCGTYSDLHPGWEALQAAHEKIISGSVPNLSKLQGQCYDALAIK